MTRNITDKIPESIYEALDDLGIPVNLKGYHHIAYAISLAIQDITILDQVTKVLYPTVAKAFDTTGTRVERAIRHAIEQLFLSTDVNTLHKYFGNSISAYSGKVTNSQFIATLSFKLRRKMLNECESCDRAN